MRRHTGALALIITPEQAVLKAQHQFDALRDFVRNAARDGQRIDTADREVFRELLGLGHTPLSAFVAAQGDGDLGPEAQTPEGRTVASTARAPRPPLVEKSDLSVRPPPRPGSARSLTDDVATPYSTVRMLPIPGEVPFDSENPRRLR